MKGIQKFLCVDDGHEKTEFLLQQLFWLRPFFDPSNFKKGQTLDRSKKFVRIKNQFFHARQPRLEIYEIHSLLGCFFMTSFPKLLMTATIPGVEFFC